MSDEEIIFIDESDNDDYAPVIDNMMYISEISSNSTFFQGYFPDSMITTKGTTISFSLPISYLPIAMNAVYGFIDSEILLNIDISLNPTEIWKLPAVIHNVSNPLLGSNFIGMPLVKNAIKTFFSKSYRPMNEYKCMNMVFIKGGLCDPQKLQDLLRQGFREEDAEKALINSKNNVLKAIDLLKIGKSDRSQVPFHYSEFPLGYLILDIIEAFYNLGDHCCICGEPLQTQCIKPTACAKSMCKFSLTEIGIGNSLYQELRRDPMAASFLISIFASSYNTKFCTPNPPPDLVPHVSNFLNRLPKVSSMISNTSSDSDLQRLLGQNGYAILKWIILCNPNQFIYIPDQLKLPEFKSCHQFYALTSSPVQEIQFQKLKRQHGSMYLWHGSLGDRWHSIFHNGLKNYSGQPQQAHGAALGPGIYFAPEASTSWGYSPQLSRAYVNSELGDNYSIISLCEVAKVSSLKCHGWAYTLGDEKACIVRYLFVGSSFNHDIVRSPPSKVPTLENILHYYSNK